MALDYFLGLIRITNLFISLFVMFYALMFLTKTSKRKERQPWDYLFVASFIFLLYQVFSLISFFSEAVPMSMNSDNMRVTIEFLFSGLVLLAFVSQHDLIIKHPLIMLYRRKGNSRNKK